MANVFTRCRSRGWLMVALGLAIFAFAPSIASAQTSSSSLLDPATLHMGPGVGTEPVLIGQNTLVTVTQVSGGATPLDSSYELILAIPNSTTCPTLTSINGTTVSISGTDSGTLTSGGDVYTALGLGATNNNSLSFSNFNTALVANGLPAADFFGLCVYSLDGQNTILGTQSNPPGQQLSDSFDFTGGIPTGTFVAAYGSDTSSGLAYTTQFTNAGLIVPGHVVVPEPSTMAIAGLGALGFVGYGLRRRLKK